MKCKKLEMEVQITVEYCVGYISFLKNTTQGKIQELRNPFTVHGLAIRILLES